MKEILNTEIDFNKNIHFVVEVKINKHNNTHTHTHIQIHIRTF